MQLETDKLEASLSILSKILKPKRNYVEVTIGVSLDDIEWGPYLTCNAQEADLDDIELGYASYLGEAVTFSPEDEYQAKNYLLDVARGVA